MKRPRTTDVDELSVVRTVSGPGNKHDTIPAAAMPARICDRMRSAAFHHPIAPTSARAMET
jgi:hypothetical protein